MRSLILATALLSVATAASSQAYDPARTAAEQQALRARIQARSDAAAAVAADTEALARQTRQNLRPPPLASADPVPTVTPEQLAGDAATSAAARARAQASQVESARRLSEIDAWLARAPR